MPEKSFREQIETNLFGVVNVTKAALPISTSSVLVTSCSSRLSAVSGRHAGNGRVPDGEVCCRRVLRGAERGGEISRHQVTIVEPGGFRTDWGGSSMTTSTVGADYEDTVGVMNRYRESTVATWRGDPKRAATSSSLSLISTSHRSVSCWEMGSTVRRPASRERAAEAEQWADVSRSADFPDGE